MSAWESTRTPSLRKSASCSIIALRNNSESPILSSSATVHSPSVDWSLLKEPHGGRLRQRPLPFTHSRGHYLERANNRHYFGVGDDDMAFRAVDSNGPHSNMDSMVGSRFAKYSDPYCLAL